MKNIEKKINEAAASIWLDKLPLTKEYVDSYKEKKVNKKNYKILTLKRGIFNGKRR